MEGKGLKRAIFSAAICALAVQLFLTTSTGDTWIQTTQTDFKGGLNENTSVTLSPGNVTLALDQDWWDANWSYRMPINITENSGNILTDYQVLVEVNTTPLISAGKMRPDGGDIRIVSAGGVEIPHWIEVFDNLSYDEPMDYNASWRFDEGIGDTAYDDSGNGNDGQLGSTSGSDTNDPSWVDGFRLKALDFDGNDIIVLPDSPSLQINQSMTLGAWFKTSTSNTGFLINKDDNGNNYYRLGIQDGKGFFGLSDASIVPYTSIIADTRANDNLWHFMVGTVDGSDVKLYLDGVLVNETSSWIGEIVKSGMYFNVGAKTTIQFQYIGKIDEVRIYDRALSADEIRSIYHEKSRIWVNVSSIPASTTSTIYMYYGNPLASSTSNFDETFTKDYGEEGLVGLWHMDEGSGTNVGDSSGNGNDGTWYGWATGNWTSEDGGQWNSRSDVKFSTGSALKLDGMDDYITVPRSASIEPPNEITVEALIYPKTAIDHLVIVDKPYTSHMPPWYSYHLRITNGDMLQWTVNSTNWASIPFESTDYESWHYIVGTYNGSSIDLYVDGLLKDSTPYSGSIFYYATDLQIGRGRNFPNSYFTGTIDEVRIYNRSLSGDEIKAHYERRKYISPEPTVYIGTDVVKYMSSGTLISTVYDSGSNGTLWNTISWIEDLPLGTNITLATKTSEDNSTWSPWSSEIITSGTAISSPRGRYIQYRATLTTTNTYVTPILSEVIVDYTLNSASPPTLSSPANNSWTNNTTPTFAWQYDDPNTDIQINFTVEINDDPFFGTINYTSEDVSSPLEYWVPVSPISDGIWYWRVRTRDEYGLWSEWSENWTIKIDATPPDPFSPMAIPSSWTNNSQPEINFSTTDGLSGMDHYEVKIDNGGFINQTSPYILPPQSEGTHSVTVRAYDLAGNFRDGTVEIYIDTLAPESPINVIANPSGWTNLNSFEINWTNPFETDTSGIKPGVWYKIGSPPVNNSDGTWQGNWPITVTSFEGDQTIYVWLEDNVGNMNCTHYNTTVLYLDTTPPDTFSPTADPDGWTTDNQPRITFSTIDAHSGISRYEIRVDSGSIGNQTSPYTLPVQTDGIHTITVRAYDNAGNCREGTVDIYIDTTPPGAPTSVFAVPNSWTNTNSFEIDWTEPSESNTSGIKTGAWYKIGSPPTSNSDGIWLAVKPMSVSSLRGEQTIYIWLEDNVGNVHYLIYATTTLYLDTTPPQAPMDLSSTPSTWTMVNSFNIQWTNPADESGVKTGAWYKIGSVPTSNSEGTWVADKPFTVTSSESGQTIYVWLEDNLGNVDYNNYATTTLYLDTTPPAPPTNVTASPAGWTISNSFSIDWINPSDDSGIKTGVWYKIGTAPSSETDGKWLADKPISISSLEGEHTVYIWLEDNVGNKNHLNYSTVNLFLDSLAPNIDHTAVTKADAGREITISATVTDNVGVKNVKLHYRKHGDGAFVTIDMISDGDVYSATIPSSFVTSKGIEYYISASDEINTATFPSSNAITEPIPIEIEDESEPWIASLWWLFLFFAIVLTVIFMLLALRRPEEEGEVGVIEPEEMQVESEDAIGDIQDKSGLSEGEEDIGPASTQELDQVPPAISKDMADDEIFQNIKKMHEEGKISEETFQDIKKRYGK